MPVLLQTLSTQDNVWLCLCKVWKNVCVQIQIDPAQHSVAWGEEMWWMWKYVQKRNFARHLKVYTGRNSELTCKKKVERLLTERTICKHMLTNAMKKMWSTHVVTERKLFLKNCTWRSTCTFTQELHKKQYCEKDFSSKTNLHRILLNATQPPR